MELEQTGDEKNGSLIDFSINGKFGYLNRNGNVLLSENLLYGVAIDSEGFISYSRQNNVLVLKDSEGIFVDTIDLSGYPFFSGNRRFVISYDSNSLSEIDMDGSVLWKKTFSSSLSAVSVTKTLVFAGTVDGRIRLIDLDGDILFFKDTRGSRMNIVYGGAVSSDDEIILTLTGIDSQLLTLWNKVDDDYQVQSTWSLTSELRRHAVAGFSNDGLFAYVEAEDELIIIGLKNKRLYSIPTTGRIQNIIFPGNSLLAYIMGRDSDGFYLIISEAEGNVLFYTRIPGEDVMLRKDGNRIIIGINNNIIGYEMESL